MIKIECPQCGNNIIDTVNDGLEEYTLCSRCGFDYNRNIEDEKLLEDITSGKSFLGKQALDLGLIDYLGGNEKSLEIAEEMAGTKLTPDYRRGSVEKPGFMMRMLKKMF